jgi:hypothetical protein
MDLTQTKVSFGSSAVLERNLMFPSPVVCEIGRRQDSRRPHSLTGLLTAGLGRHWVVGNNLRFSWARDLSPTRDGRFQFFRGMECNREILVGPVARGGREDARFPVFQFSGGLKT